MWADLHGEAFKAYYCETCAPRVQVVASMPDGARVESRQAALTYVRQWYALQDRVIVERYPSNGIRCDQVFAFEFLAAFTGRNVATFMPDTMGVLLHGAEGRAYGFPIIETCTIEGVLNRV